MKNKIFFSLSVLLFIVLTVLKLTGVIAWSWWWITAPIWIPLVIAVVVVIIYMGLDK